MGCCPSTEDGEETEPLAHKQHGADTGRGEAGSAKKEAEIEAIKRRMQEGRVAATGTTPAAARIQGGARRCADRFDLRKKLGEGAFGLVRKAIDKSTGDPVAIKMISCAQLALDKAGHERLEREIAILQTLKHPNLVNLREILANDETNEMWLVLEFVDGSDLMAVIDKAHHLSEDLGKKYLRQMVIGLNYVHSQNVAHRDLKPENIMVKNDGRVKITDFGLSNFQRTDERGAVPAGLSLKTCCGTPYYVAPEVISSSTSRGYSGFTCDVWSLGIILYAMLLGDLPFTGRDLPELLERIRRGQFTFPSSVQLTPDAKKLIKAVLTADPAKRPSLKQIAGFAWVSLPLSELQCDLVEVSDETLMSLRQTIKSLRSESMASRPAM
eukprot:TRINITY_DN19986_c0_g1_i1.p1 TRINITY_DN19986_c0_g1~~TRINITY_DN19986_c0_g1_i1.p1  ORF type:complete len:408 (+),score=146.83 TRINITY_DN19986_c0_g1_i1:78-1226(+)